MKKKIIVSVVLAVVLAATMSIGCFATEATWSFSTNDVVDDMMNIYALADTTRSYSYASYSMLVSCNLTITSNTIANINTNSAIYLNIKKLDSTYNNAYTDYITDPEGTTSFDAYIRKKAPSANGTQVYNDPYNYTTTYDTVSYSFIPTTNSLYYYENNNNSYVAIPYGNMYYGSSKKNVVFGLETILQPHFYYGP